MEIKQRIIMMRVDGVPVNLFYEPVKSLSAAARFESVEKFEEFITGYYRPPDRSIYKPVKLRITYELESEDDVQ